MQFSEICLCLQLAVARCCRWSALAILICFVNEVNLNEQRNSIGCDAFYSKLCKVYRYCEIWICPKRRDFSHSISVLLLVGVAFFILPTHIVKTVNCSLRLREMRFFLWFWHVIKTPISCYSPFFSFEFWSEWVFAYTGLHTLLLVFIIVTG